MFNFRIITTADGNQIIDRNLKTPYDALTPQANDGIHGTCKSNVFYG